MGLENEMQDDDWEDEDEDKEDDSAQAADTARGGELRHCRSESARTDGRCWRCEAKRGAARQSRISRAFRRICGHCAAWRVLNAKQRRAQGHIAFLPAHKRPKQDEMPELFDDELFEDELDEDELGEDDYGTPVPEGDPLRDYTYWVQHEQASKKGSR